MASKWVKASDNGNRGSKVIVDLKRKRASQIIKSINHKPLTIKSTPNKSLKRKRENNCESKHCSSSTKTLLTNYSNFNRSGPPQRMLFSQDGQWVDFPQEVVDLLKQDFLAKKATIEVKFNGRQLMLDILHMFELDLKTGVQKPIAWIDDKGTCFFPQLYSVTCHASHQDLESVEPESSPEIKVHVEIELNSTNNDIDECVEESNVKRLKVDQEAHTKSQQIDEETVANMFLKGMTSDSKVEIINIEKFTGGIMNAKLDLFEKQVEITEKMRGNANVKYAWFASSTSSNIVNGLGHNGLKLGTYGYGVHLTAVESANNSGVNCDVDEKGIRSMVLCRVIVGNMEVVTPGCKQFSPSEERFDSGVDNVENPNNYVVWNMNMNTHIYPEYAVSFKMSSPPTHTPTQGNLMIEGSKVDLLRVATQDPRRPSQIVSSQSKLVKSGPQEQRVGSSTSRAPNSPWMPFSKLFEAISDKVAPNDMKLVHILYESLKKEKTTREDFIKKMRSVVGDQILRSTISSLQSKA